MSKRLGIIWNYLAHYKYLDSDSGGCIGGWCY